MPSFNFIYTCLLYSTWLLLAHSSFVHAQLPKGDISIERYIDTYNSVAMAEMLRTGVPASVILGQGILESDYGNNYLASKGNNHFHMTCTEDWTCKTLNNYDNSNDKNCYKRYDSVLENYVDHVQHLVNHPDYRRLLNLTTTDYVGWAEGLHKAGYSNNPEYDRLLINLIESYHLQQFDKDRPECGIIDDEGNLIPEHLPEIIYYNQMKVVIFCRDVSITQVAKAYDVSITNLRNNYNSFSDPDVIPANTKIFLEPMRTQPPCGITHHVVRRGETIRSISQLYGIKKEVLYSRNRLLDGATPAVSEEVYLKTRRKKPPKLRLGNQLPVQSAPVTASLPKKKNQSRPPKKKAVVKSSILAQNNAAVAAVEKGVDKKENAVDSLALVANNNTNTTDDLMAKVAVISDSKKAYTLHKVRKGDTLYSLAKEYKTTVTAIKAINDLGRSSKIVVNQELKMPKSVTEVDQE